MPERKNFGSFRATNDRCAKNSRSCQKLTKRGLTPKSQRMDPEKSTSPFLRRPQG